MAKMKIKKGDTVQVIAGSSKGKTGKVIDVFPERDRVLVEGINRVIKHVKAGESAGARTGGLVTAEAPVHVSNVMLIDPSDNKPTRVKTEVSTQERNGKTKTVRTRVSARTGKEL